MTLLDLASKKVKLRKAASTHGGEWHGPCPACGGDDRFHVWPYQANGKGSYWCRSCGITGDAIQFLRDFEGMTFKDACQALNIALPDRPGSHSQDGHQQAPGFTPAEHEAPADLWQEKAEKLIAWAGENLTRNDEALSWLAGRGISRESAQNYRLGWNPGEKGKDLYRPRKSWGLPEVLKENGKPKMLWIPEGLVIPYIVDGIIHRIRIRRNVDEGLRYYVLPGSSMATMVLGRERRAFVIVEAELDAIACAESQELAGAVGLGSVSAKPDAEACAVLERALQILNALDYDAAGAKETGRGWWQEHFPRCDRWPVPQGKDPGEAVRQGIDLGEWIKAGLPPALTIGGGSHDTTGPVIPAEAGIQSSMKVSLPNCASSKSQEPTANLPPLIAELWRLLRSNQAVRIINKPERFTILRDGKYVGGRINQLVFRHPEVTDYLLSHPAEEIDGGNFIYGNDSVS